METRTTIYDVNGTAIAQLDSVSVRRSWILNDVGVAIFDIARTDPNCRADVLQFGNFIVVEHDRAGVWGGVLWGKPTGQQWYADKVNVSAQSINSIFYRRRGTPGAFVPPMTGGQQFANAIADMNSQFDSRIVAGDIYTGGISGGNETADIMVSDTIKSWLKYGFDYDIVPDTNNGALIFKANWYARQGVKHNYALEEGKNVKLDMSPIMTVAGDIKNDVLAKNMKNQNHKSIATDTESIATYGLAQSVLMNASYHRADGQAELTRYRRPRKIYKVIAIDVDSAFDFLGIGDRVTLRLPSVDFGGTYTTVRVMAREFDDDTGELALTLDEYLEVE